MARDYTSKAKPKPTSFTLDGVEFKAAGGVHVLDMSELARLADVDNVSPEGVAAIADFFRGMLGDDYDRFRKHCRKHGTDEDTLIEIMSDVIGEVVETPTQRPSDSPDGPPTTARTLKVISSDGTVRVEPLTPELEAKLAAEAASTG